MKRKKFIKRLMAFGFSRNEAVIFANGCHGGFSHVQMLVCVLCVEEFRNIVLLSMPELLKGASFKVWLEGNALRASLS